ncbi:hypothetical protein CYMTET_2783 [Cymbomonas tetramitiformis]|uniref:Uncharacterized protein n=1 Tax=Cymbomonas tetramitiformis TaxID=36881 RepID=A0AAE0H4N2_9CHLO|nr:hypothetical protein CYMTET_2783 [Cymbomonas tetramitiformis]
MPPPVPHEFLRGFSSGAREQFFGTRFRYRHALGILQHAVIEDDQFCMLQGLREDAYRGVGVLLAEVAHETFVTVENEEGEVEKLGSIARWCGRRAKWWQRSERHFQTRSGRFVDRTVTNE